LLDAVDSGLPTPVREWKMPADRNYLLSFGNGGRTTLDFQFSVMGEKNASNRSETE
jgi:hypothetical protein